MKQIIEEREELREGDTEKKSEEEWLLFEEKIEER